MLAQLGARAQDRSMDARDTTKLHEEIGFVGLRAQATAVGLLQLSIELQQAGILDEEAISRIKDAIAEELALSPPKTLTREQHKVSVRQRLDRLFAGKATLSDER